MHPDIVFAIIMAVLLLIAPLCVLYYAADKKDIKYATWLGMIVVIADIFSICLAFHIYW